MIVTLKRIFILHVLKWSFRRAPLFFKDFIRSFYYKSIYTAKSLKVFRLHSHRQVPSNIFFYNRFGRFCFALKEIICFAVFKNKSFKLEYFEQVDENSFAAREMVYPKPPMYHDGEPVALDRSIFDRIEKSYKLAYDLEPKKIVHSQWWTDIIAEFKTTFFDSNFKLEIDRLKSFRQTSYTKAAIINDQCATILREKGIYSSFLQSLELIMEYHKMSDAIDHDILMSISESKIGGSYCPVYRGQRLSQRLLTHAYYVTQLRKFTHIKNNSETVILDLGGAYGGLLRQIGHYYSKAKLILIELPEVVAMGSYFLQAAFPEKKVATLADLKYLSHNSIDLSTADIFVLPTWCIELLETNSIDLVVNSTSLGEMSTEYGIFYLENIERICKRYFFSNNRGTSSIEKYDDFGFYNWPLKKSWETRLFSTNHTGVIEWIGETNT
ncbi:MAG: putative sugar O-methyltransferase [Pseudobacteriovorax sp.]|nr:putative sugar O-methyltransferase [Pseudobacteriovorax sp.]